MNKNEKNKDNEKERALENKRKKIHVKKKELVVM
jgi:hypothetical protein